jgi:hypothetical protein
MMGSKEILSPDLDDLTWQSMWDWLDKILMMMSNVFNQCTMYWNVTQSLSMFLQTQLMSILTLSSNKPFDYSAFFSYLR